MPVSKKIFQLKLKQVESKIKLITVKLIFNKIKRTNNNFKLPKYAVKAIIKI